MSTHKKSFAQISILMRFLGFYVVLVPAGLVVLLAGCRLDVQQVDPLAAKSKAGVTTEDRALTPEQFALLKPGMNESQAIQILGEPSRIFHFYTKPGSTPVILSRQVIDASRTSRRFRHRDFKASPPRDKLVVLEYESPGRNYFVVFRDEKLFYTVGPVSDNERDPETIRTRYGGPDIHIEEEQGHGGDAMELFDYPEKGIAFLRHPGQKEFEAKLVVLVKSGDINQDLIGAARKGDTAAVQSLLEAGADVNAKNKDGSTALMKAVRHTDTIRALLAGGSDVDAKSNYGDTALLEAANIGHTDTVRALLQAGADVNAKDKDGYTALTLAAWKGHTDVVKLLENSIGKRRQTQTMEAAKEEDGTLKQLMEVTDENFVEEVEKSKQLVMVLFDWKAEDASRCRPCRVIAPIVEQLARDYAGEVRVIRIVAETNPKTSAQFQVIAVPAILFFKEGKLVDTVIGGSPKARLELEQKFKEHLD